MKKLRRKVYMTAGYNTISLGTGRKEFNPRKPRPGIEHYIKEAGQGVLQQIGVSKMLTSLLSETLWPAVLTSKAISTVLFQ